MISKTEAREMILNLFEEEALIIGGLVAIHELEDDFVWRIMKNLDVILGKTIRRLDDRDSIEDPKVKPGHPNPKPHPAIEDFLLKLRRT